MNNYYFDPKTNTLHGPIDRMPPERKGSQHEPHCLCNVCLKDLANHNAYYGYLLSLPSHPHTFTGQSRVVPEDKIRWVFQYTKRDHEWKDCSKSTYDIMEPERRRRVATPITEEVGEPDHSHYSNTTTPDTPAPGYTSTSGEEAGPISVKDFYNMSDREQLNHLFPLTAQPDKQGDKGNADNSMFTKEQREYVDSVPEDQLRSHLLHQVRLRDNMEKDRDRLLQPPTPQQGEKEEARKQEIMQSAMALVRSGYTHAVLEIADLVKGKNIDLPVDLSDKLLDMLNEDSKKQFNALLFEKELSAIDPAQQPHSPALQGDDEVEFLQNAAEENAKKHYHNLSPYQAMVFGYIAGYKKRDADPDKKPASTHVRSQQQEEIEMLKLKIKQLESNIEDSKHPF